MEKREDHKQYKYSKRILVDKYMRTTANKFLFYRVSGKYVISISGIY